MTNEMELENKKEEVRMPWQGKVLMFFVIFGWFITLLLSLIDFVSQKEELLFFKIFSPFIVVSFFNFSVSPTLLIIMPKIYKYNDIIIFFGIFLINIFLVISFLKGKKWSIIFSLINSLFSVVFLWKMIFDIPYGVLVKEGISTSFFILVLFLFGLYLQIFCLNHPYFNQKKKPKEVLI